jgi:hypothetical protein
MARATIVDAGLLNRNRSEPSLDRSLGQFAIADDLTMALIVEVEVMTFQVFADLVLDGLLQELTSSLLEDRFQVTENRRSDLLFQFDDVLLISVHMHSWLWARLPGG